MNTLTFRKLDAITIYTITSFAFGFFTSVIYTLDMVYFSTVVGMDALQLVLVGTVLEVTVFLFEIPTGVVADVYSRRLSTIIGYFVMGVGFLIEGSTPIFSIVLLAQVVWGLGWTFISGAQSAWITDEVGSENVAPVYLQGTQFYQLGSLLGIPLSVFLGQGHLQLPILAGGVLFILLALFLILFMPEEGFKPVLREERENWALMARTFQDGVGLIKLKPPLILFLAIGLFIGLSSEGYDRLWTAHILENFTFPAVGNLSAEGWFGIMRAGSLLFTMAAAGIIKRRMDVLNLDHTVTRLLQGIYGFMVLALLLLAFTRYAVMAIVAYWLIEMLRNTAYPLSEAWVNQHIDSDVRATVLSMTSQVDAIGQVAGGPIVGLIGLWGTLRRALAATAVILSPVFVLYGRAEKTLEAD